MWRLKLSLWTVDGRLSYFRAAIPGKSGHPPHGTVAYAFGAWGRWALGVVFQSSRYGLWRVPTSGLLPRRWAPGGKIAKKRQIWDPVALRECQWRILILTSALVEGYTIPSNYSSARPDLRPGFATVGCLVKGCRFPTGKRACALVGVTLLLIPPSAA